MERFFVPVDFSNPSENALEYAFELAQTSGAKVIIHHTWTDSDQMLGAVRDDLVAKMETMVQEVNVGREAPFDVEWEPSLNEGTGMEDVARALQSQVPDMVIMGTKGASGIREVLVGSNTVKLIDQTTRPVLVIPEWAEYRKPRKILLCSDYKDMPHENNLAVVKSLALFFDCEVRIAHVRKDKNDKDTERHFERKREGHFFEPEVEYSYKTIYRSDVLTGIKYYLKLRKDNDILVMTNRKHSFYEKLFRTNHTYKMAFHTELPLLVIRE